MEFLCMAIGIVALLLAVTVIGHGLWLVFARLFGSAETQSAAPPYSPRDTLCIGCGRMSSSDTVCPFCGRPKPRPQGDSQMEELAITARQVDRLYRAARIGTATHAQMIEAIQQERARGVAQTVAAQTPTVAPPVAAPVPKPAAPAAPLRETPPPTIAPEPRPAPPPQPAPTVPVAAPRPLPPSPPRRPLAEVLAAFMEERNIRWGELIGGLLIVCCSTALVVSLWSKIAQVPFLKFFIFTAVTAALYGAGLYTEHRWKLPTTSRGVLIIASLLVPLNFLAIVAFSEGTAVMGASLAGGILALIVFLGLAYLAGQVLTPEWPAALTVGVVGASAAQLVIRPMAHPEMPTSTLLMLGAAPLVCYLGSTWWMLMQMMGKAGADAGTRIPSRPSSAGSPHYEDAGRDSCPEGCEKGFSHQQTKGFSHQQAGGSPDASETVPAAATLDRTQANIIFTLLGLTSMAALVPMGLLALKSGDIANALRQLAALVALLGLPALATGVFLWQRITDKELTLMRTAGTAIAVIGAIVMLGALVPAWPQPSSLVPIATLDAVLFAGLAIALDIPIAHLPAGLCIVIAYLIGYHALAENVDWSEHRPELMIQALIGPSTGPAMVPLVAALTGGFVALTQWGRRRHGLVYAAITAVVVALSLALVTWHGLGQQDDEGATWVYAVYAMAAFAGAVVTRQAGLSWAGSALLLVALVQGFVFRYRGVWGLSDNPLLAGQVALLTHATLGVVVASVVRFLSRGQDQSRHSEGGRDARPPTLATVFSEPLVRSSLCTSILAALLLLSVPFLPIVHYGHEATRAFWLAGIWAVMAFLLGRAVLFTAAQVVLTLAVPLAVIARLAMQTWFQQSPNPLLDVRTLQASGIALAGLSLAWLVVRLVIREMIRRADTGARAVEAGETPAPRQEALPVAARQPALHTLQEFLNPPWPTVDRLMSFAVLGGLVLLAVFGLAPGVSAEFASNAVSADHVISQTAGQAAMALGGVSWVLLLLLAVLFTASLWERFRNRAVLALILTLAVACPLVGGHWASLGGAASGLRWCTAAYWLLISAAIWARRPLYRAVAPFRWPEMARNCKDLATESRALLVLVALAPMLAISVARAMISVTGEAIAGPASGTFFVRIGETLSYAVPLVLVSAGLVGHGLRERSAGYTFVAGLVINFTVTLTRILWLAAVGKPLAGVELIDLIQFNAIAAAANALAWQGARFLLWRRSKPKEISSLPALLIAQVGIALVLNVLLIAPAAGQLALHPDHPGLETAANGSWAAHHASPFIYVQAVGSGWGWAALAMVAAAATILGRVRQHTRPASWLCAAAIGVACMIAFDVVRWDTGRWQAYHTLLVGVGAAAWSMLLVGWAVRRWTLAASPVREKAETAGLALSVERTPEAPGKPVFKWQPWVASVLAAATIAFVLAMRGVASDPGRPWWSAGMLVALSILSASLAPLMLQERYLFASAGLFNLAASVWWITRQWQGVPGGAAAYIELAEVNAIALLAPAAGSLAMRLRGWLRTTAQGLAFHEVAAVLTTFIVVAAAAVGLGCDIQQHPIAVSQWTGWLALAVAGLVCFLCLLDAAAEPTWLLLYLLGLATIGLGLDPFDLKGRWLAWSGVVALAGYTLATGALCAYFPRRWLAAVVGKLGNDARPARAAGEMASSRISAAGWLAPMKKGVTCVVVILATWVVLRFSAGLLERTPLAAGILRASVGLAMVIQTLGIGLLARTLNRLDLRRMTLLLIAAAVVLLGWAPLEPGRMSDMALDWPVVLVAGVIAVAAIYTLAVRPRVKLDSPWLRPMAQAIGVLVGIGACTLLVVIGSEAQHTFAGQDVPISLAASRGLILVLIGIVAVMIQLALDPAQDPLRLSEKGRMGYVYAAEVILTVGFVHLRLSMPWLFQGFFLRYWPLIVMGISFVGVGLAEVFRRQDRRVLAEPLEATGIFLPILPVIGFWVARFQAPVDYSVQLVLVGLLYAILAVRRRSFGFGILAALAGHGALWYLLSHTPHLALWEHPQLWFIPAALSVLVAVHLNRDRLSREQVTALRYIGMSTLYVSSTTDIFLNGVLNAPWLPLVLMGLSVAGVLAGIMLRIRSFLFLGSAFLTLALVTMIRYATLNFGWTWLWYVAGIALGTAILIVFGLFEKKRSQMLQLIDDLKQWQA